MSMQLLAFAPMMTVEDVVKALRTLPPSTWVCIADVGPLHQIEHDPGANEPFVILTGSRRPG